MASLANYRALALSSAGARLMLRSLSTSCARNSDGPTVGIKTHTGQVWEADDYRRFRFVEKDKLVNRKFAIDLIAEDPVVVVDANHVFSDSGGALGHPKVYINLDKPDIAVCGYSGRKFIQKKYFKESKHGLSISYDEYLQQVRPES